MTTPQEELTFEWFVEHVNKAEEPCCGMCFSFGHYKGLGQDALRLAYLDFMGKVEEHDALVAELLEAKKDQAFDNDIYFLVSHCEFFKHPDPQVVEKVKELVLARAEEAVNMKHKLAWVMVRAYGWIEGFDPDKLLSFLDKMDYQDGDDLVIWQVVMQCVGSWAVVEKYGKDNPRLQAWRDKLVQYLNRVSQMQDHIHPVVVYANGLQALASLQDPRLVEMTKKFNENERVYNLIKDFIPRYIKFLTERGNKDYVAVVEEWKNAFDHATPSGNVGAAPSGLLR